MFLDLFKKERYPIRLETVRAAKSLLYKTISYDIELLNDYYGIFPEGFAAGLLRDLRELLGNEIAGELRLAFYDPVDPEKVYLERSYRLINGRKGAAGFPHIKKYPLPKPYEFDIFVYFSDGFLALSKGEQERLLNGFNFKGFSQLFQVGGGYIPQKLQGQVDILPSHPAHERLGQRLLKACSAGSDRVLYFRWQLDGDKRTNQHGTNDLSRPHRLEVL